MEGLRQKAREWERERENAREIVVIVVNHADALNLSPEPTCNRASLIISEIRLHHLCAYFSVQLVVFASGPRNCARQHWNLEIPLMLARKCRSCHRTSPHTPPPLYPPSRAQSLLLCVFNSPPIGHSTFAKNSSIISNIIIMITNRKFGSENQTEVTKREILHFLLNKMDIWMKCREFYSFLFIFR